MTNTSAILIKVNHLIKKYGIKSLTMDDSSRELGMSKKTLYQFVNNKTELVNQVLRYDFNETKKQLSKIAEKNKNAILQFVALNKFFAGFMKGFRTRVNYDLKKYYPGLSNSIKEDYYSLFTNYLSALITRGKKEGIFRKEIKGRIIAKLLASRIEILPMTDLFTIDEYTHGHFNHESLIFNLNGLVNSQGKKITDRYNFK